MSGISPVEKHLLNNFSKTSVKRSHFNTSAGNSSIPAALLHFKRLTANLSSVSHMLISELYYYTGSLYCS